MTAVATTARAAGRNPEIEALVQVVAITDDARSTAERITRHVAGASVDDLLASPFAWIGSCDEITGRLRRFGELGIRNYVIRETALADVRRIMDAIA